MADIATLTNGPFVVVEPRDVPSTIPVRLSHSARHPITNGDVEQPKRRYRKNTMMTEAQKVEVVRRYCNGERVVDLAAELKCGVTPIYRWIRMVEAGQKLGSTQTVTPKMKALLAKLENMYRG